MVGEGVSLYRANASFSSSEEDVVTDSAVLLTQAGSSAIWGASFIASRVMGDEALPESGVKSSIGTSGTAETEKTW